MNVTRSGRRSLGAAPAGWYASTTGSAGNAGTVGSPWDLATALAGGSSGQVKPGDTIWLRSGTYAGPVTSTLAGAVGNPIIVRSYPGEWAKIDGVAARDTNTFTVQGSDTWYWGFEVLNSNTDRVFGVPNTARGECFYVTGPRTKFINLIVHDGSEGFGLWDAGVDVECYGCLVYNNGSIDTNRGNGHGFYMQNTTGTKKITNCISCNNFSTGMKAFGEVGSAVGITYEDVISFNNGSPCDFTGNPAGVPANYRITNMMAGTAVVPANNITVKNNCLFHKDGMTVQESTLSFGYISDNNDNLICTGNYVAGGDQAVYMNLWNNVTMTGNTFYQSAQLTGGANEFCAFVVDGAAPNVTWNNNTYFSTKANQLPFYHNAGGTQESFASWKTDTGFDASSTYTGTAPTTNAVFVKPNIYERGRAHVAIFNWQLTSTVAVDLSTVLTSGDSYEVRNAANWDAGAILSGVYGGGTVNFPTTGLDAVAPIGRPSGDWTGQVFNAYIVRKT